MVVASAIYSVSSWDSLRSLLGDIYDLDAFLLNDQRRDVVYYDDVCLVIDDDDFQNVLIHLHYGAYGFDNL